MARLPLIPSHLRTPLGLLAAVILLAGAFFFPVEAAGAPLTIPSETCPGTLQECIDLAAPGETIEIATDVPFDENLLVFKSLTLTSAPGVTGRVGNGGADESRTITIRDDKAEGPIDVTIGGLGLPNARIEAVLGIYGLTVGGNRITIRDCDVYFNITHNNTAAVNVLTNVPAAVAVVRNRINTTGQAIAFHTGMKDGAATLLAEANVITTDTPEWSNMGVYVDVQVGGTILADVADNVIRGVGGCYCGGASGIRVHANDGVQAVVNLVNNTLDAIDMGAPGIAIVRPPAGDGRLTVNAFNNIVTRGTGAALRLPEPTSQLVFNNDYNDFFGNREPSYLGAHALGEHTLDVDPLYVDHDRDLRLRPESPLLNAGTADVPGGLPAVDADGLPRVSARRVDLGAYEQQISSPTVTVIDPPSGNIAGGTPVTIHGVGFFPGARVTIGALAVEQAVIVDQSTIRAVTPAHGEGTADVVVTNPGDLAGILPAGFAYVDDVRPIGGLELSIAPRRRSASLRLTARLSVDAGRVFDPTADGLTLAVTPTGGTPLAGTIPGARFVANRSRNRFRFADRKGNATGGIIKVVVRTAGSGVVLEVRARASSPDAAGSTGLAVDVTSGANRFAREATCAPRGRSQQLACR